MDNDRLTRLLARYYGRRLDRWYRGQGLDVARAAALRAEYVARFTKAMGKADFGPDNGRFTSYLNCLSGVIAYAMAREQGFSAGEGIACYDYLSAPLRKLAAGMWNAVDLLPNGFEIVRDNVRGDLMGPKGVCWTTEVIEDSDERFEYRCHTCLYYDICCEQGYPEAIQLFCNHDHHAWDRLRRHVRFVRYGGIGERKADGSFSDGRASTEPGCLCHDAFVRVGRPKGSAFWNRFASVYDLATHSGDAGLAEAAAYVASFVRKVDVVLDAACGTGSFACAIAPSAGFVAACDVAPAMVAQAAKKTERLGLSNVACAVGDLMALDFADGSFDVAMAGNVLHLLDDPQRAVDELLRVTRPGGVIAIPNYVNAETADRRFLRIIEAAGFTAKHEWDEQGFIDFLAGAGLVVEEHRSFAAKQPLCVAICRKPGAWAASGGKI